MAVSPISAGINSAYSVGSPATVASAPAAKAAESAPAPVGDQVSLGEEGAVKKKGGLINWLKDLLKTEVEGPEVPYIDRVGNRLEEVMKDAKPGDIPDSMPKHESPSAGEPDEWNIPGGGSYSGISIPIPAEKAPNLAECADFHTLPVKEAVAQFQEMGISEKLSPMEKGVIKEYCGHAFGAMNSHLLNGEDTATGTIDRAVRVAAGALDKCEVPSGIILNRCASLGELLNYVTPEDYGKYRKFDKKGKTEKLAQILNERLTCTQSTRKTFISTSAGGSEAQFLDKPKVFTKFYIGEGVKGAFVSADPNMITFKDENEYLLAPNQKTTVMGVEYDKASNGLVLHVFVGDRQEA